MAWIAAGASILGSLGASGAKKKEDKLNWEHQKEGMGIEGMISRQNEQFAMELKRYYDQLDKQEKKRGLDQFRQFSTLANYAPNFVDTNPGPQTPAMPTYNQGTYAPNTNAKVK